VSLREGRYDAVFHLVTAANGAESFYTLDNNVARSETPLQAREVDHKLVDAWCGHPRHYIIDNTDKTFEMKMQQLVR
jgi:AAA domain